MHIEVGLKPKSMINEFDPDASVPSTELLALRLSARWITTQDLSASIGLHPDIHFVFTLIFTLATTLTMFMRKIHFLMIGLGVEGGGSQYI